MLSKALCLSSRATSAFMSPSTICTRELCRNELSSVIAAGETKLRLRRHWNFPLADVSRSRTPHRSGVLATVVFGVLFAQFESSFNADFIHENHNVWQVLGWGATTVIFLITGACLATHTCARRASQRAGALLKACRKVRDNVISKTQWR